MPPTTFTFRSSVPADFSWWLKWLPNEVVLDPHLTAGLPALWTRLLADEAMEARSIVSANGGKESVDAFGASVFLRPGLIDEWLAQPRRGIVERLYRALLAGESPIISGRDLARTNSGAGVDVCILHFCERPVDLFAPIGQQLLAMGHAAFRDAHLGYHIRAIVHETFRPVHKALQLASGMAQLHDFAEAAPDECSDPRPSVQVGMTRRQSLAEPAGSPISLLFRSEMPRYFFAASERRILRGALSGRSDADIAAQLGVTRDAVKKTWRNVFARVDHATNGDANGAAEQTAHRRRDLLEYIRQHPEELRPFVRPLASRGR
jgi:DNA-binding CsgD family transcriptional regulator